MLTKLLDEKKIEALKVFLNDADIEEYAQSEIRSAFWHIIDSKENTVVAILAGVPDAITGGYGL